MRGENLSSERRLCPTETTTQDDDDDRNNNNKRNNYNNNKHNFICSQRQNKHNNSRPNGCELTTCLITRSIFQNAMAPINKRRP